MFRTNYLQDNQSYLVALFDHFSLTVGVLKFNKRKPELIHTVRSFFESDEREFRPRNFEKNLKQCCDQLEREVGELPKEICMFIESGDAVAFSTGYTFSRANPDTPVVLEEIDQFASDLLKQAQSQAQKVWHDEYGYATIDQKLLSMFVSHLALDKKHFTHPIGKSAAHITLECLFFYGSKLLVEGMTRSVQLLGYRLLTFVPMPLVFLNHICNRNTFLENHLHIHLGYDSTSVVLHLGKKVQQVQILPFGWEIIDQSLAQYLSALERESLLMGDHPDELREFPEWHEYGKFLTASLLTLFEKFGLHWSFTEVTISSQGPIDAVADIIKSGALAPWIQKKAKVKIIGDNLDSHWLQYLETLDPLFSVNPHPLLSLVRSAFFSPHGTR